MKFLSDLRISHKISALMVGLIVGFIIIGVTYYTQISIESDALADEQEGLRFRSQLAAINTDMVNLFVTADQVINNGDGDGLTALAETAASLRQRLLDLHNNRFPSLTVDNQGLGSLDPLIADFDQYLALTQDLADTTPRQQQSQLADRLQQQQAALAANLLAINSDVFGFLASSQSSDSALTLDTINQIDQLLTTLTTEESQLQQLTQQLRNVRDTLSAISTSTTRRQNKSAELKTIQNQITSLLATTLASSYRDGLAADQANAQQRQVVQAVVTAIIFMVAMGTAVGVYFLYKSIVFPMVHMQSVIGKINRGKTGTRVKVLSNDELGDLGKAFNQLLDERIKQLEDRSLENDQLNNSIISLIKALGLIAQKDLTVKVPVSADITGTVSDAVNLLTTETARTLEGVKHISEQVNAISEHLQEQSSLVIQFADGEKRQILATAKALEMLARAMNDVASHAETADASAAKAIENTQQARHSVEETVDGIRTIRETISETEKRTKRLGDRSQEISGIVNLINTIAERTHILALNASMHAASAGEAGRGFAVVADEVQRLAESARQSTDEIAAMVNNMRVETSDTVAIMNTLIAQVAEGSRLAEEAGKRMSATENATQVLVEEVKLIAKQAVQQAEVANRVRDRSSVIRKFTDKTGKQLEEQKYQTDNLKQLAGNLVNQVNVFTLPVIDHRVVNISTTQASVNNQDNDDNISPLHAAS